MAKTKKRQTRQSISFEQAAEKTEQKKGFVKRVVAIVICALLVMGIVAMPILSLAA